MSVRLNFLLTAFMAALASNLCEASDIQNLSVLGFSKDAAVFVFETFGEWDAADGGFSNLYFIETKTGRFLPGTPIRVFCQEDTESSPRTRCKPMPSLDSLRKQAISRAAPLLSKIGQLDQGALLASAPIGQVMPDPYAVSFFHPSLSSLPSRPMYPDASIHILRASVIPLVSTCQMETGSKGLLLRLDGQVLYEDKKLPEDRKCAEDYSITEVRWRRFTDVHVALISVFKWGFEGYDRTFIAVPFLLAP